MHVLWVRSANHASSTIEPIIVAHLAWRVAYLVNLCAERARALLASSMGFFGGALVSSAPSRLLEIAAIASTAAKKAASLAFDGLLKPLTLRTNCNAAARISSSVAGGSKL